MQKQLQQLQEFHRKFHATWHDRPTLVSQEVRERRMRIMQSEVDEVAEAIQEGDLEHIAKELGDVLYVVFGTIGSFGLADKMQDIFEEIHRSNMSKDYSGIPDDKAVKGPHYCEADISRIL